MHALWNLTTIIRILLTLGLELQPSSPYSHASRNILENKIYRVKYIILLNSIWDYIQITLNRLCHKITNITFFIFANTNFSNLTCNLQKVSHHFGNVKAN